MLLEEIYWYLVIMSRLLLPLVGTDSMLWGATEFRFIFFARMRPLTMNEGRLGCPKVWKESRRCCFRWSIRIERKGQMVWLNLKDRERVCRQSTPWRRKRQGCLCCVWIGQGFPGRWRWLKSNSPSSVGCNDWRKGYKNNWSLKLRVLLGTCWNRYTWKNIIL